MDTDKPKPHQWHPDHLRLAVTAAGVALWAWNVDSDQFTLDERGFELWGMEWTQTVSFEELSSHIHPRDRVGYGSKLVDRSVSGQLGGSIDYEWSEGGLIVTLRVNRDRLAS